MTGHYAQFVRRSTYNNLEEQIEALHRKMDKVHARAHNALKSPETAVEALKEILEITAH